MIGIDGKMTAAAGKYAGMKVEAAREAVVEDLKTMGMIEKIDEKYNNSVAVCYKGEHVIEPTVLPNWFVKVESLKKPALDAVLNGDVKIYPKWQEITYTRWMEEMRDWPISRQIVWGIRIPAWYSVKENPNITVTFFDKDKNIHTGFVCDMLKEFSFEEIENGLQTLIASNDAKYVISKEKPGDEFLQETDTFDTWFSSGHWPLVTLHYPDSEDFKYFYPTSVMETGWEIIRFWVSRMIMFGIYLTGKPPFEDVYLHGLVRAVDGKKMSKSMGNVVDPQDYIPTYGADALRMGLISGTANGKDFAFPKDKVVAYRNFSNKIWNMGRFMLMLMEGLEVPFYDEKKMETLLNDVDKEVLSGLKNLISEVDYSLEKYRFSDASDAIYQFMWHEIADKYIELIKDREDKEIALSVFRYVFLTCLKLLHPFMPFVTEAVWESMPKPSDESEFLALAEWPTIA